MKYFRIFFFLLPSLLLSSVFAQAGNLETSKKKTLFVFPIKSDGDNIEIPSGDTLWTSNYYNEVFVRTFERFNYVQLPQSEDEETFLTDAKTYLEKHAREIVQKQKEPDGRIREVRVTLDDLINAVENGYVFFPKINQVEGIREYSTVTGFKYIIKAELEIYNAGNGTHIATIEGDSEEGSAKLGLLESLTRGLPEIKNADDPKTRIYRTTMAGVYQQMKTNIRQTPEFQLKAIAFDTDLYGFSVSLGKDMGVRKDKRYKVWSLDRKGRPNRMLAFGKARRIEEDQSRIQVLIGNVGEGDQVLEDAKFGLNFGVHLTLIPWQLEGYNRLAFSAVDLKDGSRISFGHVSEYNIAWFINISELYLYTESNLYTSGKLDVVSGMAGFRKKFYINRVGFYGSVKAGGRGTGFDDKEFFNDNNLEKGDAAFTIGYGYDIGLEYLLNPNLALTSNIGYYQYPEKTLLKVLDPNSGDWQPVTISNDGIVFSIVLIYSL